MIAFRCYGCVHTGTLSIRIYLTNIHIVFLFVCCSRLKQTDRAGHHPVIPPSQRRCAPNWAGTGVGRQPLYTYYIRSTLYVRLFTMMSQIYSRKHLNNTKTYVICADRMFGCVRHGRKLESKCGVRAQIGKVKTIPKAGSAILAAVRYKFRANLEACVFPVRLNAFRILNHT